MVFRAKQNPSLPNRNNSAIDDDDLDLMIGTPKWASPVERHKTPDKIETVVVPKTGTSGAPRHAQDADDLPF